MSVVGFSSGRAVAALVVAGLALVGVAPPVTAAGAAPPVLDAISLSPAAGAPGGSLTITVDVTHALPLREVDVVLRADDATAQVSVDLPVVPEATRFTVTRTIDAGWATGTYRIASVFLADSQLHTSYYRPGGRLSTIPAGGQTHDVDLDTPALVVTGGVDRTPPSLGAISSTEPTRQGQPATVSWSGLSDSASAVSAFDLHWTNRETSQQVRTSLDAAGLPAAGSASVVLPTAGHWRLDRAEVVDARANVASYGRDGRLTWSVTSWSFTHTLDLAALDVALVPAAPTPAVRERPGRLTVVLPADTETAAVVPSYTVMAQPSGRVLEAPTQPNGPGGTLLVDLAGLAPGVPQTVRVVAHGTVGDSTAGIVVGRPLMSRNVHGVPDVTGDGRPDVIAQREGATSVDTTVYRYPGSGRGALGSRSVLFSGRGTACGHIGPYGSGALLGSALCQGGELLSLDGLGISVVGARGWAGFRFLDGGHDLTSDGRPDVIGVDPGGVLRIWPQTSSGRLGSAVVRGSGWQTMISVVSAGDLSGDRRADLVAVDTAGRLWLYPGTGRGGFGSRTQIGSGWSGMAALFSLQDLDRDGHADLGAISADGRLRLYRGTGAGSVRSGVVIGAGWSGYL